MKTAFTICLLLIGGIAWGQGVEPLVNTVIAEPCKDDEYLLQLFCLGQVPANHNPETVKILINHGYVVGYSEERRNPVWAVYKASGLSGTPLGIERDPFFSRDLRTDAKVHGQTFGGGMDRGHMVPNAAIVGQYGALAQMETFLMSNMCPQSKNLNQGPWMRLEKFITHLAEGRKHLYVFCGPIFGSSPAIIKNGAERKIQIPDKFYMILIDTDKEFTLNFKSNNLPQVEMLAYIFPQSVNRNDDFKDRDKFGASVDEIETATNLDFFPGAEKIGGNRWKKLEETKVMLHWEIE